MSVSLTLKGLTDLVKSLERMPDGLQQKASATVRQAAIETAADLQSKLPIGPGRKATKKRAAVAGGNLRKGVRVVQRDPLVWQVVSAAPHAWIHEEGTKARTSRRGNRGVMPASKIVAGVASSHRRAMNGRLEQVLVQVLSEAR